MMTKEQRGAIERLQTLVREAIDVIGDSACLDDLAGEGAAVALAQAQASLMTARFCLLTVSEQAS